MNEELLRLLTAYVDGELSPPEERHLRQLLRWHPQAADLLDRLRRDRAALERLPRRRLDPDFADRVIRSLPPRVVRKKLPKPAPTHAWWPVAVAASVLLAVSAATALLVYDLTRPQGSGPAVVPSMLTEVQNPSEEVNSAPSTVAVNSSGSTEPGKPTPSEPAQGAFELLPEDFFRTEPNSDRATAQGTGTQGEADRSERDGPLVEPPVLTAPPVRPLGSFKTLDLKLPLFLEPRNLDVNALSQRLGSEPMHLLDIACLDSSKTFDRFQAACKAAGLKLVVESELSQRLSRKLPTPCLIYVENTSPTQMAALLKALEQEEIRAENYRRGEGQITSIMLQPLDEAGRKHLAEALGVSVSSITPPAQRSESSPTGDPTRPLSEDTLRSLERVAGKAREPSALALIYLPNRSRLTPTKELKQFLDSRLGMAPDAIHVVIYLRAARG
ncbi:MAG: hypothetical protein NZM31_15115 [Gemmatales bacterium]|nr:hypothetical protein [Gemmatales bacterium]MDW8388326.1 hypothetical protein [Gemmatales bacterium]